MIIGHTQTHLHITNTKGINDHWPHVNDDTNLYSNVFLHFPIGK